MSLAASYGLANLAMKVVKIPYTDCGSNATCLVPFMVDQDLQSPIGLYYRVEGYSQMERGRASSYSPKMLQGNFTTDERERCEPEEYIENRVDNRNLLVPCGSLPRAVFTDFFAILELENFDEVNVVLDTDKMYYRDPATCTPGPAIPGSKHQCQDYGNASFWLRDSGLFSGMGDPHFIAWMRQSAWTPFRKLFSVYRGREGIPKGAYTLAVRNLWVNGAGARSSGRSVVLQEIRRQQFGTVRKGPVVVFGGMAAVTYVGAVVMGGTGFLRRRRSSMFHPSQLARVLDVDDGRTQARD